MEDWKDIFVDGIVSIEKCVAEFDVNQFDVPNGKFRVRIYEQQDKKYFYGFTNLKIRDSIGGMDGGVGYGDTIEEALKNTLENFMGLLREKDNLLDKDFEFVPYEYF